MPDRTIEHIREKIAEANLPDDRKDRLFDLVDELRKSKEKGDAYGRAADRESTQACGQ